MVTERIKITHCNIVYQAVVEVVDEDGKIIAEQFEIGRKYVIDVRYESS